MFYLHLFYKYILGTFIKFSKFLNQIKNDEIYQNLDTTLNFGCWRPYFYTFFILVSYYFVSIIALENAVM